MADTRWFSAGFTHAQWAYLNADGIIMGTSLLSDNGGNLGRLRGAVAAPFQINEPDIQKVLDQDSNFVSVVGDAKDGAAFTLETSIHDIDFRAAADGYTGALNNKPASRIYYPNISRGASRRRLYLLFSRPSYLLPTDPNDHLETNWSHLELYSCTAVFLGSGFAFQTAASYRYLIIPHETRVMPDGRPMDDFFNTTIPGGVLDSSEFYSELPVSAVSRMGPTAPSTYNTLGGYGVSSASRTSGAIAGEAVTVSSVVSNVITLATAWSAPDIAVSFYQSNALEDLY